VEKKSPMSRVERSHREKVTRYSIRKYSFGAASVAVAALFMFLGNGAVSANELSKQDTPDVEALAPALDAPSTPAESTPAAQPVVEEPAKPAGEESTTPAAKPAAPEVTTPALDKKQLENYISEVKSKLSAGTYANKTEESLALLNGELASAESTLASATTQDELNVAYRNLVTTVSSKLKNKPKDSKDALKVDTTNGQPTVGKNAENTEPKSESNSIENSGSHDSRNGKEIDKENAFRTEATAKTHEPYTRTEGNISYTVEFSDDAKKEIYAYNEEDTDIEISVNSTTGKKLKEVTIKKGSGQYLDGRKIDTPVKPVETDGFGWSYHSITSPTTGPVTVRVTGKPNDTFKGIKTYTKQENQNAVLGDRYLHIVDEADDKISGGTNSSNPGYFKMVVKSQTYKYQPKDSEYTNKVLVANAAKLTETELADLKRNLKVIYSTTNTDARLEKLKGTEVADTSSVVDTVADSGENIVVTYKDGSTDTISKGKLIKSGPAPVVDTAANSRDTIFSTDEKITGTGVAGATVKVTVRNPEKTEVLLEKETTVNAEGKWEISLEKGLNSNEALPGAREAARTFHVSKPKNPVEIIQTVNGIESEAKNQEVSIGPAQILPSAASKDGKSVVAGSKEVTLKVPHDAGFTYFWYTNKDNNQRPQLDIKREDDGRLVMSGGNANKATIKEVVKGDFYDTVTLTLTENIKEGVDLEVIPHNGGATHGHHLGRTKIKVTNEAPVVSAVEENKNEKEVPTDASVTKADLLRLVKVTDHEDDLNATLGTKGNARIVSIDGDENAVKVDTSAAGEHTVIFRAVDSQGKESADYTYKIKVRQNNAPEVTIPYSIDGKKDVYVYANEDFDIPIKYTDDTGKVVEASVRQGGNKELPQKAGQNDPNVLDNQYDMTVGKISEETTATPEDPATIHITGNLSKTTPGLTASSFPTDENGEFPIVTRYATATDTDGKDISNHATGSSYATDPGAFRIVLKAQTAKYDIAAPAEKVSVSDLNTISDAEFNSIKEKVKIEYSTKNPDKNIPQDKKGTEVENQDNRIESITKTATDVIVTYKDGSTDKRPLLEYIKLDKDPAINAVNNKATEQIAAINNNGALTQAEKNAAINKVNEVKQVALDKIDDATNAADVTTAGTNGATAVGKVNPVAKENALKEVADKLAEKEKAIDARADLSDKEKADAKKEAKRLAGEESDKIKAQPDNKDTAEEAAEAQKVVNDAKTAGVNNTTNLTPIAKEQAKKTVADKLAEKEKAIDARTDLTDEEKEAAKTQAKEAAKTATDAIDGQPNFVNSEQDATAAQEKVNQAKDTGLAGIAAANPTAEKKPAANREVADAATAKKAELQGEIGTTLTPEASAKLQAEVDEVKKASEAAIAAAKKNANVDKVKDAAKNAIAAINSVRLPANKVIVPEGTNPLSEEKITEIKNAIAAVNPPETRIELKDDGTFDVTLPNGKIKNLTKADLTKTEADLDKAGGGNDINRPMDKVIVGNPNGLTDDEKEKIKKAVRDVNPNSVVSIDDNGTVTVSTPEGHTAGFPVSELVRTLGDVKKDNSGSANTGIRKPADKVVGDATNADDQAKVTAKLKKLNGDNAKVKYDDEGNATVVLPNGTVATIPAADLFKTPEEASKASGGDDINKPNSQTVVDDITALQGAELEKVKAEIKAKVEAVNPDAVVVVDNKGNAIVTTPEGKTAVIDADDLIKKSTELPNSKAGNYINNPADRVQVADKANLKPEEIAKIKVAVEAVNPGAVVVVDEKGNATVTTPDSPGVEGKTATIPVSELVKVDGDKDTVSGGNQVNTPADRVVLEKDITALTPAELTKLKEDITAKVKAVNPDATVVVDAKGNATVTTPAAPGEQPKTATIPVADLVKAKTDLADPTKQDAVNKPADKLFIAPELVDNPDADLSASKDAIKAAVEAVNPGATVVVDDKGNATVTTKDGKTVVIPKADLVKKESDKETAKAGNSINKPVDRILVTDPANIDEATKKAIEEKVKAVNPDATVVVDAKGNATVTSTDGKTATIPVADLVKTAKDAENPQAGNYVNKPADKVSATKEDLADPAKKDAVVEKIKAAIKAVNPEGTTVVVDDKGNATVTVTETNEDGTKTYKTATIPVEDLLKNPADKDKANAGNKVNTPATKVVVTSPDNKAADEDKIKAEILKVNSGATVVFDTAGNATVTTKDGAVATISASDLAIDVADLEKADKQDVVKNPADKTIVKNPAKLKAEDIAKIKAAVEKVNPSTDPANPTTVVDSHGNATVTTPDGKTKVIPVSELVKTQDQADGANAGNNVNKPADKVSAKPADLEGADKETLKTKIADAIKAVNPEGTKVFVDDKGNATVTVPETNPDGTTTYKTATIPVEDLLKDPDAKDSATAGNKVNTPADRVILDKDIAALSPDELAKLKEKIADKVKAINPDATVVVDEKGNATVTTKDGAVATIPAADLLKAKTDLTNPTKQPAVKIPVDETVVANKDGLSEQEQRAIRESVQRANPDATVFVDNKGNATVTTPDGKTAVIAADDLVKTQEDVSNDPKAGNLVNKPADGVFVKDGQITDDVKAKIKDKVQRVNPDATVVVDENGNAIVTTPEGKTVTIPVGDLTKTDADKATVKAGNKISTPADRVLVKDRDHLTAEDIKEIEKNIKAVNPDKDANNPTVVLFDDKGNATVTVTNPDDTKTTATIPVEDLVKPVAYLTNPAKQDLIKKPVDKVLDNDPDKAAKIKKAVEEVNPGSTVVVDDNGNATITTEDGKSFVIPAKDLVKTNAQATNEKAGNDINKPSDKVVADTSKPLTDEAKKAIAKKIKAVNLDAKTITVFVDDEGNATVTVETEDENGDVNTSTATILAKDLVRTEEQAGGLNAGNNVNTPADKVEADPDNLTEENKTAIAENIKSVNPEAKVAFDKYGNATVTTKDGAIATIPVKNLVKTADEATKPTAGNNVNKPADKVVADPADFNDNDKKAAIKKAVEDNIKAVNPGAFVAVDDLGNATVTLPNGKTAVIPAKDLTKPSTEVAKPKAGNDIVKPADKTVVANPDALTDDERNAIGAKVSEVNPDAKYIAVDDKGNVTVTLNDGKVAVIPAKDLTKTADEAVKPKAGNDVVKPADKTVVANPELLTDDEKDAIVAKIKAVNPGAEVAVDEKGNATVTLPDGKSAVIPAKDLTKNADVENESKAGNDIVKPASKVKVESPDSLTPEEKKAIGDKVRAVNPEAKSVVVDEKGNATVTLPDGKSAVIPASDLTKSQADLTAGTAKDNANVPAAKTKVAKLDSLTPEEQKAIEDKVKALNPGATVVVDDKGNATVVKDGNVSVIPSTDLVKVKDDAKKDNGGNDANTPAAKTVVDPAKGVDEEAKKAIADKVKAVNPEGTTVVVDGKGNATVTKPDGTVLNIPASDLVIPAANLADEAKKAKVKTPAFRTLVGNKENLKDFEKEAIKKAIEAVNPEGTTVVVDDKGNATVTLPDGSTATISKDKLVKEKDDSKAKRRLDNLDFDFSKVTVANLEKITDKEKEQFQFMILGAITNVPEFDLNSLKKETDDQGTTIYTSKNGAKIIIDKNGNATIVTKDGEKETKEVAISIDEKGNVTIVTKDGQVLAIPRDDAFRERVYYSEADSKTDKSKLESAIHQLDDLISNQADQLGAINTKEAKALLEEAKKVFANAGASQAEVDAMVKRIEDFMAKVAPATDHATPANDQSAQTPAVAPATAQVAANANQAAANARTFAKELPNTGTADSTVAMVAAATSALLGLGLAGRRRKEDEEA